MSCFVELIEAKKLCAGIPYPEKMRDVLMAVHHSDEKGITTRDVANICDLSVYSARNWLMKLEQEGRIYKVSRPRNSTWHYC